MSGGEDEHDRDGSGRPVEITVWSHDPLTEADLDLLARNVETCGAASCPGSPWPTRTDEGGPPRRDVP